MGINVNDIIGKGFVFEVDAEEIVEPSPTGTIGVFIGGADFGPVNTSVLITDGIKEFYRIFGKEPSNINEVRDIGWYAAEHHFKRSSLGYYTRLANIEEELGVPLYLTNSKKQILSTQEVASIVGTPVVFEDALGQTVDIPTAIAFDITEDGGLPIPFVVPKTVAATTDIDTTLIADGDTIEVNGDLFTKVVGPSNAGEFVDSTELTALIQGVTGVASAIDNAGIITVEADHGVSLVVTVILVAVPTTVTVNPTYLTIEEVVDLLNATVNNPGTFAYTYNELTDEFTISFTLGTPDVDFVISGSVNTASIGLADATANINEVVNFGSFVATQPGKTGDGISFIYTGYVFNTANELSPRNSITVYLNNSPVTTINNIQFHDDTRADYIGTKIKLDSFVNDILTYEVDARDLAVDLVNRNPEVGVLQNLAGGKSGGWRMTDGASFMTVAQVIEQLQVYSNPDLYNIDFICYPAGNNSLATIQSVQDAMTEICEDRQDCFTILDPPEGLEVGEVLDWSNGNSEIRDTPLDSFYSMSYYPWIKVRFANNNIQDVGPSVKVAGTITQSDIIFGEKLGTPAGQVRGILEGVVGLERILTKPQRDLLYADELNGRINPLAFNISTGYFIDGNKTTRTRNDSLRRINTVRTVLFIKKAIQNILPRYFFEPSVPSTWAAFENDLADIMKFLESKKVILPSSDPLNAWEVVADDTINTAEVVNRNGMVGQLSYVGTKSIERIKVAAEVREQKGLFTITVGE